MTNPDTNTLNGSLEQLGITLATNLTSKGVTASANDGLTTLAGKINNITDSIQWNALGQGSDITLNNPSHFKISLKMKRLSSSS